MKGNYSGLKQWITKWSAVIAIGFVLVYPSSATAMNIEYFIGVDESTSISRGDYIGLPNPNAGHLTFLFSHPNEANPSSSHFHSIGAYSSRALLIIQALFQPIQTIVFLKHSQGNLLCPYFTTQAFTQDDSSANIS